MEGFVREDAELGGNSREESFPSVGKHLLACSGGRLEQCTNTASASSDQEEQSDIALIPISYLVVLVDVSVLLPTQETRIST